jgi:hypothetical protein
VLLVDDGASQQADEANDATVASELAGIAMLPSTLAWFPVADRKAPATSDVWPSLTHDPEPLEKPPRSA